MSVKKTSAWLSCLVSTSFKSEEAYVRIEGTGTPEPPAFFVARSLVDPKPKGKEEIPGWVLVTLVGRENGTSTVDVPGEPISYGPKIEVPTKLLKPPAA